MQTNQVELATPQIDFDSITQQVLSFQVSSKEQYILAGESLKQIKQRRADVASFFKEMKAAAYDTWKKIVAREKFFTDKLDGLEKALEEKRGIFRQAQEKLRIQEENKLRRESEAKAAEERKRLQENARRNEKRGNEEKAEAYREQAAAVIVAPVYVHPTVPRETDISVRKIWKAEVTDKKAFIECALKEKMLLSFVHIDAEGLKRAFAGKQEVSGIKFFQVESETVRR